MSENPADPDRPLSPEAQPLSREQRLAAKLRENLRRRKAQARDLAGDLADDGGGPGALPKSPGKS